MWKLFGAVTLLSGTAYAQVTQCRFESSDTDEFFASDAENLDLFGTSIDSDGDVAIVGANGEDDMPGDSAGAAYVFRYDAGLSLWVEEQKLLPMTRKAGAFFGSGVAIQGDVAVASATLDVGAGMTPLAGAVYVYRYDPGMMMWNQEARLTASDGLPQDRFGNAVAIDGDVIVVGAFFRDEPVGGDAGAAYVYRYDAGGMTWNQEAKLVPSTPGAGDTFGVDVDVSGDTIVVGASLDDDAGSGSGTAWVFRYDPGAMAWSEEQKLVGSNTAANDFFGSSAEIQGDLAVVGAPNALGVGGVVQAGAAYAFRYDPGAMTWNEEVILVAADGTTTAAFGSSVSIDAPLVAVGAGRDTHSGKSDAGAGYVYRDVGLAGSPAWVQEMKLVPNDPEDSQNFAFFDAIAVSGNRVVAGAFHDDEMGTNAGSAYTFDVPILALDVEPKTWSVGTPVTITTCGGTPGKPALLFLFFPQPVKVDTLPAFPSNGLWLIGGSVQIPGGGITVLAKTFSLDAMNQAIETNEESILWL